MWKSAGIQPLKNGPISARAKTGPTGGSLQFFFYGLGSALFARRGDSCIKRVCLQRSAKPFRNCDRAKCIFFWRDVPRSGTCGNGPLFQRLENPDLGSRFSSPWKTSPFPVSCFQGAPSQGRGAKKRSCHRRPQIEGYCLLVGSNERFEFCGNPPESSL